jgi:hypothetical protein
MQNMSMPEGQMYYSTTCKNLMGSYASQLQPKERWMVINYIKSKQKPAAVVAAAPAPAADSTAAAPTK